MSFTRGPYRFVTDPDQMGENWLICSGGDWVIETDGLKIDELGDDLATGQLLAAAPDLYEALQAMMEYWSEDSVIEHRNNAYTLAENALRKAATPLPPGDERT